MDLSPVRWAALLVVLVGCDSGPKVVPVGGKITLDGKPLANASVNFQPMATGMSTKAGPGAYATTDAAGSYTLRSVSTDEPGAVVGMHRVEIDLKVESDDRDPKLRPPPKVLPARYNRQSELQFEVPSTGTSEANFDLKSN